MTRRIGVFCGSNAGLSDRFVDVARDLGSTIADAGIGLVYGGGHVGLMGVVADAALERGGEVTGVITDHLVGAEIAHAGLTKLETVGTMHERKARMSELCGGFVVLPGGFGTLDESLELLTWNQLGLIAKPVVFLDIDGYFAALLAFFDHAVAAGFVRSSHRALAQRATSVDDAVRRATEPVPETPHKWLDRDVARPPN